MCVAILRSGLRGAPSWCVLNSCRLSTSIGLPDRWSAMGSSRKRTGSDTWASLAWATCSRNRRIGPEFMGSVSIALRVHAPTYACPSVEPEDPLPTRIFANRSWPWRGRLESLRCDSRPGQFGERPPSKAEISNVICGPRGQYKIGAEGKDAGQPLWRVCMSKRPKSPFSCQSCKLCKLKNQQVTWNQWVKDERIPLPPPQYLFESRRRRPLT